jgi:hypothetical protein
MLLVCQLDSYLHAATSFYCESAGHETTIDMYQFTHFQ